MTWKECREGHPEHKTHSINSPSLPTCCAFCIADFDEEDKVVQLSCHHKHIFHHECFESYLKHVKDQGIEGGQPKCPFCKKDVKFWKKDKKA